MLDWIDRQACDSQVCGGGLGSTTAGSSLEWKQTPAKSKFWQAMQRTQQVNTARVAERVATGPSKHTRSLRHTGAYTCRLSFRGAIPAASGPGAVPNRGAKRMAGTSSTAASRKEGYLGRRQGTYRMSSNATLRVQRGHLWISRETRRVACWGRWGRDDVWVVGPRRGRRRKNQRAEQKAEKERVAVSHRRWWINRVLGRARNKEKRIRMKQKRKQAKWRGWWW